MKFVKKVKNKLGKTVEVHGDPNDPKPVEVPTELKRPESTDERMRRLIREHISPKAQDMGFESLEESEDFDVEDPWHDDLPITNAEFLEMRSEFPEQMEKLFPDHKGSPETDPEQPEGPEAPPEKEVEVERDIVETTDGSG